MYSSMKEDTVWSFERLQSYIDGKYAKEKELPENWVYTTFTVSFAYIHFYFSFLGGGRICSQSLNGECFLLFPRNCSLFCNNYTPHFCNTLLSHNRD